MTACVSVVQQDEINDALERGLDLRLCGNPVTSAVTPPPVINRVCPSRSPSPARRTPATSPARLSPANSPAHMLLANSPARTNTNKFTEIMEAARRERGDSDKEEDEERQGNPITLTWEETK